MSRLDQLVLVYLNEVGMWADPPTTEDVVGFFRARDVTVDPVEAARG